MNEHVNNRAADEALDFDPFAGTAIASTFETTEPQKEVWLSSQLGADASCAYNESVTLNLAGELDGRLLEEAWNAVVQRHEALRATISANGESLMILESLECPLPVEDWTNLDEAKQRAQLDDVRLAEVTTPFDLLNGPLVRTRLIKLANDRHSFVLSAHHIICDGWSFEPLLSDLSAEYSARRNGEAANLPPADSFHTYVQRQSDPDYADEVRASADYWLQRFRTVPEPTELTPDFARPRERSFEAECLVWTLPKSLIDSIQEIGSRKKCSLMTTMLCAFEVFVSRQTGQTDLVIGVPSAGQLAFDCPALVGHCVNLLPMRTHIEAGVSFAEYIASRRRQVLTDFDHQKFTYGSLVKSLPIGRDNSRMPLTSLMFNIDQPLENIRFAGLDCELQSNHRKFEAFEMFLNLTVDDNEAVVECQYNTNLFDAAMMKHRMESFQGLLESIARDPDQKIEALGLLSEAQLQLVCNEWANGPSQDVPAATVIDGFASQVSACASQAACEFGDTTLTYAGFDELTSHVARGLVSLGVGKGQRVGIRLRRSEDLLTAIVGVLKSGAAYVPLDPEFPEERLAFIASDAELSLIISDADSTEGVSDTVRVTTVQAIADESGNAPSDPAAPGADDVAYLIYTSGSTGKPKGVVIRHAALANFLYSMAKVPGLSAGERLLAVTSPSFDISILELLGPLLVGGTVVIADNETVIDGAQLAAVLDEKNIDCLQATPSTWRILQEAGWAGSDSLRALCGGEALDGDLADWLADNSGSAWNMYGPTETTIWSTTAKVERGARPITLGRPIHNTTIYVLDAGRQLAPPGTPGELFIGGDGVAERYWGRPELTAERFVAGPVDGKRIYATGDQVRFRSDGSLEYLGRQDNQVKLHGYRIELGDIEAAMQRHDSVAQAVVAVKSFGRNDDRLVAYVKSANGAAPDSSALRSFVAGILPNYMVPNHVVAIDAFPMTPNRKIDRRALPTPQPDAGSADGADNELHGETQESVARIWRQVLGVSAVGRRDDFFDLGGHSILVTRVVALMRSEMGIEFPFRRFFEAPVLEEVADAVDALGMLSRAGASAGGGDDALEEIEI